MAENQYTETLSGDGQSTARAISRRWVLHLAGSFGGGTAKAQVSSDGATWVDIPDASWTAATNVSLDIGIGQQVRVDLSGSTTPSLVVSWHLLR